MDSLLGLIAVVGVSISLSYAAFQDYKTREVTNWVWVGGLVILPITLLRISPTGLVTTYVLEVLMSFVIVVLGFRARILGGADGKAILLISLTYPWIIIEGGWLLLAPVGVLIGGFLIVGSHSLVLLILNAFSWHHRSIRSEDMKPAKRAYWLTRRLTLSHPEGTRTEWIPVSVPLVVYILLAYIVMLAWMVLSIIGSA